MSHPYHWATPHPKNNDNFYIQITEVEIEDLTPVQVLKTKNFYLVRFTTTENVVQGGSGAIVQEFRQINFIKKKILLNNVYLLQLWFCFLAIMFTNAMFVNYSKTFGLSYINDDHFFSKVTGQREFNHFQEVEIQGKRYNRQTEEPQIIRLCVWIDWKKLGNRGLQFYTFCNFNWFWKCTFFEHVHLTFA